MDTNQLISFINNNQACTRFIQGSCTKCFYGKPKLLFESTKGLLFLEECISCKEGKHYYSMSNTKKSFKKLNKHVNYTFSIFE